MKTTGFGNISVTVTVISGVVTTKNRIFVNIIIDSIFINTCIVKSDIEILKTH